MIYRGNRGESTHEQEFTPLGQQGRSYCGFSSSTQAGNQTIRVRATDSSGNWSENMLIVNVRK